MALACGEICNQVHDEYPAFGKYAARIFKKSWFGNRRSDPLPIECVDE